MLTLMLVLAVGPINFEVHDSFDVGGKTQASESISWTVHKDDKPLAIGEAAHTPIEEVVRVLNLLPKPKIAFVDLGCGYDARWCVAAAEKWKCKCIGVEINHERAMAARERVRNLGLDHLIAIIEGDAGTVEITGDVAVAYLYPDLLKRLKPRIEYFKVFASYMHQPPGVRTEKNGDTWIYRKQQMVTRKVSHATWNGVAYSGPQCNNPNCAMCASIRQQLSQTVTVLDTEQAPSGRWEYRRYCVGGKCSFQRVWVSE